MRAGHAFSVSLEMIYREFAEPVSGEFRRTFEEHNLGLPIEVALQSLAKRVPSLDVHFFVSAVLLQKRTGGNLAEILDKLAYVIRERFKLRGRIRAVSAHGRMTATSLSCIPIAVAVLMFYTNPDYVKFFFTDDVGNIMLGGRCRPASDRVPDHEENREHRGLAMFLLTVLIFLAMVAMARPSA